MNRKNLIIFIMVVLLNLIILDFIKIQDTLTVPVYGNGYNNTSNIESYIEYGQHSVLAVHYPVFGRESIDVTIRDLVFAYISNYKNSLENINYLDTQYKSELHIDYKIYPSPDNEVTVKFYILENLYYFSAPETYTETLVFDLIYDKQINLWITLKDRFAQVLNKYRAETLTVFSNEDMDEEPEEETVSRIINKNKPMVALTFDDGPYVRTTIPILDTLKEHNTVATFFVLGNRVPNHKSIVKRISNEGNEIGNHSYSHKQLTRLTNRELKDQIDRAQKIILEVVGSEPRVMRPTYGTYDKNLRSRVNLPMILWSIDPMDWKLRDAEKIADHILSRVKDGDIILMHDIFPSTAEAVKIIVPELLNRGYQLVTVSELYEAKGTALQVGNVYRHLK